MREINAEEQENIIRRARLKLLILELDKLEEGQSLFVYSEEVKNMSSLIMAMKRKGKKVSMMKQGLGYTFTRVSL